MSDPHYDDDATLSALSEQQYEHDTMHYDDPEPGDDNVIPAADDTATDTGDYGYEYSSGHTPCGDDDND